MLVWTKEDTFKVFGLVLFLTAFYVVFQQLQQAEKRLRENEQTRKTTKNNDSSGGGGDNDGDGDDGGIKQDWCGLEYAI